MVASQNVSIFLRLRSSLYFSFFFGCGLIFGLVIFTQTFCTLSSPSQATHYLTLPLDRITSTTKATPLPTARNVNIVATNIKHGGWVSFNSTSNLYLILTAAPTNWFHFSRQFSEDVGDVQVSHGFIFKQILGLFLTIDLRTLIWSTKIARGSSLLLSMCEQIDIVSKIQPELGLSEFSVLVCIEAPRFWLSI